VTNKAVSMAAAGLVSGSHCASGMIVWAETGFWNSAA
jgi:hypothetical protein